MKKLSRTQQELLDAMKEGVTCFYMPYIGRFGGAYYFRSDNHARCTSAANALFRMGLVEEFNKQKYNSAHELRIKEAK